MPIEERVSSCRGAGLGMPSDYKCGCSVGAGAGFSCRLEIGGWWLAWDS